MEILLELQDVSRFRRTEQLAAYVGLTPSQYSSADKIRMGRITGAGKPTIRSALVESCWHLIRKDKAVRKRYEKIRVPEKNNSTSCLSLGQSTALHPPTRISICAAGCALQTNQNPARSCGIISYRDP
jgi:transposase